MREKEDALENLADYSSIPHLKHILNNIYQLKKLSEKGNQTALCIVIDIEIALKSTYLTEKQKKVLKMKFFGKETNDFIAEQMNISETAVRKHIQGGLKRIQKLLLN
jgi:DNA-directed RNA polymerase specialized sigma24 family protein